MLKFLTALLVGTLLLSACSRKDGKADKEIGLSSITDTKVMQYAVQGKTLYEVHCANCHQKNGKGLGKVIPPLNPSDYMLEDIPRTVRLIRHGLKGEIVVNGVTYNRAMPGNPQLTPLEIAQIATYIYNVWGHSEGLIHVNDVVEYLKD
ncbi:MAG: c-type cytochrome [Nitritalea sp.]